MEQSVLAHIFNFSIIIGFTVLLLNVIIAWIGGVFAGGSDVDIDTDADVGEGTSTIIPFNLKCLCVFLVVFGATGHMARPLMTNILFTVFLITICFVVAAFTYWVLYRFIVKKLKENDASALSLKNLKGKWGEVTLTISGDSIGTIVVKDSVGGNISFRAKIDPYIKENIPDVIEKGESVLITEVDNKEKLCYVFINKKKY